MSSDLKGTLSLTGTLTLREKVLVGGIEALVVLPPGGTRSHGIGTPVEKPVTVQSPPAWVISSDNQSVTTGGRAIVTGGTVQQNESAPHFGTVRPANRGVRVGGTAICVVGDQGEVEGTPVTFNESGQG